MLSSSALALSLSLSSVLLVEGSPIKFRRQASANIGNFGSCSVPAINFGVGFDNRKETSFEPADQTSYAHSSADNIDIITQFICNTLTNSCDADAQAKATCATASAAADAQAAGTGAQADAFNNVFGIETDFASVQQVNDQGQNVGTPAAPNGLATSATIEFLSATPAATIAVPASTAAASAIGDFGSCSVPAIEFGVGFNNRKETSFQPANETSYAHTSADNIDIITQFICNTLTNSCGANALAKSTCATASSAADAAAVGTGAQADAFNAAFGIVTNFASVPQVNDQGDFVSTPASAAASTVAVTTSAAAAAASTSANDDSASAATCAAPSTVTVTVSATETGSASSDSDDSAAGAAAATQGSGAGTASAASSGVATNIAIAASATCAAPSATVTVSSTVTVTVSSSSAAAAAATTLAAIVSNSAAAATSTSSSSNIGNFGSCSTPQIVFGQGFDGRTETAFEPADLNSFNHGSADNIDVISGFICSQLQSACKADATATATCATASQAADAAAAGTGAQADAFNAVFGIQTDFAAVQQINDQGQAVGTPAAPNGAATAAVSSAAAATTSAVSAATSTSSSSTLTFTPAAASAALASASTASASSVGNFGSCSVPQIEFAAGLDGRKETAFAPVDEKSYNHGSADNIAVITGFMCDALTNTCGADATAKATCQTATTAANAATALTGAQADAFNAVFGITTNFAAVQPISNTGVPVNL